MPNVEDKIMVNLGLIMIALSTITKSEGTRGILLERAKEIENELRENSLATKPRRWWQSQ